MTFNSKLALGFIISILFVIGLYVLELRAIRNLEAAHQFESHTHIVLRKADLLIAALSRNEEDQHLKILGAKQSNPADQDAAEANLKAAIDTLQTVVSDNKFQVRRLDTLKALVNKRFAELRQTGMLNSSEGMLAAARYLTATEKNNIRESIYQLIDRFLITERSLLEQRRVLSDIHQSSISLLLKIAIGTAIGFLLLFFISIRSALLAKKLIQDQLEVSESKFSSVFMNSKVGMAIVDMDWKWIEINTHLPEMLGYSQAELFQKSFKGLTHPEDFAQSRALLSEFVAGQKSVLHMELRYGHKEGHYIWCEVTASLITNADGTARFIVMKVRDISLTKDLISRLEITNELVVQKSEQLQLANEELEGKNVALFEASAQLKDKLAQLEDFNKIVAHNLRGPVGSIQTMIEMLANAGSDEERKHLMGMLENSSKGLRSTLDELMNVLEIRVRKDIEFDDCNLAAIISMVSDMLKGHILRKNASIQTELNEPVVRYPKVYLESIIYNMLSNSLKYTKADVPPVISISSATENGRTVLRFKDNGLGIDLNLHGHNMFKLNKIFHKGFDSKGVGLFITKTQIETLGGSITVESERNAGSVFTVTL